MLSFVNGTFECFQEQKGFLNEVHTLNTSTATLAYCRHLRPDYAITMPLYAFGSNGSGQLGIGHARDVSTPQLHLTQFPNKDAAPLAIRAGGQHTVIIYPPGEVSVCGRICRERQDETWLESRPLAVQATFCSANWETICTTTDDPQALLVWGKGAKGELGRGPEQKEISFSQASTMPSYISGRPWTNDDQNLKIVDIASGLNHTVVVLSNGEAWGWGSNRHGQLDDIYQTAFHRPWRLRSPFKVRRAVCGSEFTYLVGNATSGHHRILGKRRRGSKGNVFAHMPKGVPGWVDIGVNWAGIFVLFETGRLISWGRNEHGQMCPPGLPQIKSIAIGSEHALAWDVNDRVLAWGWGEHGNCGPSVDKDSNVKYRWNVIEVPNRETQTLAGIGAGCATSFIWTVLRSPQPKSTIAEWAAEDDGLFPKHLSGRAPMGTDTYYGQGESDADQVYSGQNAGNDDEDRRKGHERDRYPSVSKQSADLSVLA